MEQSREACKPIPPRRFSRGRRAAATALALLLSAGLVASCAPAAAPSPTAAPAKPAAAATTAPAAKPADTAKPAAPATTAPAKPADAAKPAAPAAAAPATKPEPKGSVTLVMPEEPPSLSSFEAYATYGYPVLRNVQESLVNRSPANELVGELATKWERANDTTWRFTLRQGVKFHDGTPFNAEAAAHGINHTWSKDNNFRIRQFVGPEFEAKAAGEYVLDVVTETPDPILPERLYFSPIPSMKQLKENPEEYKLKPIGTGPYKFVEWIKGQHIKIDWNPDWWGHTASDAYGAATIKDATFLLRAEREVRTAMIQRGEAHFARWVTSDQCKSAPACANGPSIETIFLRMDTMHPAMADKRVREAMALAIDKSAVINDIMGGGPVASMLVGPSALGYDSEIKPYPYDPARAKQLVAEAKAAGIPVESTMTNYGRRGMMVGIEEATEAVSEMLKAVGFTNVQTRVIEVAVHTELWNAAKPIAPDRGMIAVHAHGNELMDFGATLGSYYRCEGRPSTVCDPKLEEMNAKAFVMVGKEREAAFKEIAKYIHEQFYTVPIGHPDFYFAISDKLDWKARLDGFILLKEMKLKS